MRNQSTMNHYLASSKFCFKYQLDWKEFSIISFDCLFIIKIFEITNLSDNQLVKNSIDQKDKILEKYQNILKNCCDVSIIYCKLVSLIL